MGIQKSVCTDEFQKVKFKTEKDYSSEAMDNEASCGHAEKRQKEEEKGKRGGEDAERKRMGRVRSSAQSISAPHEQSFLSLSRPHLTKARDRSW